MSDQKSKDRKPTNKMHMNSRTAADVLTPMVFIGAALCLVLGWWAFAAAIAAMLFLVFRDFHINPEKAFEKYKLNP